MKALIIMYHYVRDIPKKEFQGIYGLGKEKFREQLEELKERYEIITLAELYDKMSEPDDSSYCVLTFDDGLKDHYTNVFPVFKQMGIKGTFFAITYSTFEKKVIGSNKIHLLMEKMPVEELAKRMNTFLKSKHPDLYDDFEVHDRFRRWERKFGTTLTINFKYTIASLPQKICEEFLSDEFPKHFPDEEKVATDFYLTKSELKEMADAGMEIGSHGHLHRNLNSLTPKEQEDDIQRSITLLEKTINKKIVSISYPYGEYSQDTIEVCMKLGLVGGVTIVEEINDSSSKIFELARIDISSYDKKIKVI